MSFRAELRLIFYYHCQIIDEISPKSQDTVIGTGEKLSSRIFSAVLASSGVPSTYVSLERCVSASSFSHFDDSQTLDYDFYKRLKDCVSSIVSKAAYSNPGSQFQVPVVTGYMGQIPGGIINAIGRGYTDFTAALVASGAICVCDSKPFQA